MEGGGGSGGASEARGGRSVGSGGPLGYREMALGRSCTDVAVLLGISSTCSISSCFTTSSTSTAWSGESEPAGAITTNTGLLEKQFTSNRI